MYPSDNHMHTRLCKHAAGEPKDYVKEAIGIGLTSICFADHMPAPDGYDPGNRMSTDQFDLYRQMVSTAQEIDTLNVGFGIEADYYPGCEEYLGAWLKKQDFDLVIGSIHYIGNWPFESPEGEERWHLSDTINQWREYFQLAEVLAKTGIYDIWGHPDVPKKYGYRIDDKLAIELAIPVLDAVAESGMAIEINTSGLRKPVGEIYPSPGILKAARERDIPVSFGSDAHRAEEVGYCFKEAITLARKAGYDKYASFEKRKMSLLPITD